MGRRTQVAIVVASVVGSGLLVAGCGDDGNDRVAMQERAERLAAEVRSATTVPAIATGDAVTTDAPTSPTVADVEPTGVVVPVTAIDNIFRPEVVTVRVGDEVVWENRGTNDHDILHVDGGEWGVEVEGFTPGAVYAHVFTEPGEYHYYCSIHGNETVGMIGTIVVEG